MPEKQAQIAAWAIETALFRAPYDDIHALFFDSVADRALARISHDLFDFKLN